MFRACTPLFASGIDLKKKAYVGAGNAIINLRPLLICHSHWSYGCLNLEF